MTALPAETAPIRTTCPYCGTGCGVLGGPAKVTPGDPAHPTNFGRVCGKGAALGETLGLENRLLHPMIAGRRADWDTALDLVASRFTRAIAEHGPDSVAFYVSGQLLTEDYYVANKLMKGFIGSANIDTNSRLCMASSVAGHRRAFGEDLVPCSYEDLDKTDLVVLVGSNAAWCHPILFRRLTDARERRGTKIIAIDPRRTASASAADLHLAVRPGSDVALFNGLLAHLADVGALDTSYIAASTAGFADALANARADAPDAATTAALCGLAEADVAAFFAAFAGTERVVTVYSQGVNQSSRGTDKVNAIINCHLATGRIGRPGMGPFSFTGQPNAMGGREVGGLANQLAAHMAFDEPDIDRVARFWGAPAIARMPGLKAVDLFSALGSGRIKALWVIGTNPAASLPDGSRVRTAMRACDFLAVSDCVESTDTMRLADVVLPAAAWGEKDGTVTNSERRISRQRAFIERPGETRPDWAILSAVARRMGFGAAFAYRSPADIFREHAALSAFENHGQRLFDIGALASLTDAEYEALEPVQWPAPSGDPAGTARLFADGRFPTSDGRARFVPVRHALPVNTTSAEAPLVLNTGRLRDQWHTMTRTGDVARLMAHAPEPALDINPADAARFGLVHGGFARITSAWGRAVARVHITSDQNPGAVFLPMHWTDELTVRGSAGRVVNPACDAISGQPELKHTPARVEPVAMRWEGVLFSRRRLRPRGFVYWTRTAVGGGYSYALAGAEPIEEAEILARSLIADPAPVEFRDRARASLRLAAFDASGALSECLLIAAPGALPDREWLAGLFNAGAPVTDLDRRTLLSARASMPGQSQGRIVCSCFGVGEQRILSALREERIGDVAALGRALRCGTNCGSCLPELKDLLARADAPLREAAE